MGVINMELVVTRSYCKFHSELISREISRAINDETWHACAYTRTEGNARQCNLV